MVSYAWVAQESGKLAMIPAIPAESISGAMELCWYFLSAVMATLSYLVLRHA